MPEFPHVAGFILAGGASKRMGRDKALLQINGTPLALRTAQLLAPLVSSVAMVAPADRYGELGLALIADDYPGAGPLGGIATALRATACEWNLVVSCDMPFLTQPWLEFLISTALAEAADALVPVSAHGRAEPLCAMYHRRCLPAIRVELGMGIRKVTTGLAGLAVRTLPYERWREFDSVGRLFKNMNTPEDYADARIALE